MNRMIIIGIIVTFIITICIGCIEKEERQREVDDMELSSSAFDDEETIPSEYTCDRADVSPPLTFSDVPDEAQSLALIMDDPDAPMGTFVHWLVWNIPPNVAGFAKDESITYPQGSNGFGKQEYGGPCPPSGSHRYFFKLYALDTMLDLDAGADKKQLEAAMSGHVIEESQLMGTFR